MVSWEPGLCDIAGLLIVVDDEDAADVLDAEEGHICPPWPSIEDIWCWWDELSIERVSRAGNVDDDEDEDEVGSNLGARRQSWLIRAGPASRTQIDISTICWPFAIYLSYYERQ